MSTPPATGGVVVLGATSPIARALALALARRGRSLLLAARDPVELERIAADVRARVAGADVRTCRFDVLEPATHAALLADAGDSLEGVVLAAGQLGDAARARTDAAHAREITEVNYGRQVELLTSLAERLERQRRGFIIGLGSVAGDRGRQSNYVYGAAKGALALFLQGLRNRLAPAGVQVLTAKLGFVDTAMTWGLPLPLPAASPEDAARGVLRALDRGVDVAYVPGWWRWVMLAVRAIPESIFKRMKL